LRLTKVFINKIKLISLYFSIFFLVVCTGTSFTPDPANAKDIESFKKLLNQQAEQIEQIEQKLIIYETIIINDSLVNDEISQLKHELKYELNNQLKTTLDKINTDTIEQDYLNILNKVQQKIQILEDRTLYTDSLYFEIVSDMVMVENKISSLILSFKEMNDLSVDKTTKVIPKITDEEFTAKYIESLSHYQNAEWDLSLNGFNYLIQVDSNHDLADNCQYWIGEVYYARNDFGRSIIEFEKVYSFPGTNKSDDAQFKMGLCYLNIGQIDRAKQEFKNLLEFYPNSEYNKRAQDYIRKN
jgi:TolA-binding protein